MLIAIDIRALCDGIGGVSEYTRNIVRSLVLSETVHSYALFINSWRDVDLDLGIPSEGDHHFFVRYRYPNKFFNAMQSVIRRPYLDELLAQSIGKKPDIIFLPNIHFTAISAKTPVVLTIHDLSFLLHPELLSKKSFAWHHVIQPRRAIARARHIIAVSERTKGDCVRVCKKDPEKITVTHIDCDSLFRNDHSNQPRRRTNEPGSVILFGAHELRKNAEGALDAFALVCTRGSISRYIRFVLVGRRSHVLWHLHRRARELGIHDRVRILEPQSAKQKSSLYQDARALLYPSIYEGFGLPLIEAALCEVPIISSARGSIGEVIGDGAILVDPCNVHELALALECVLERRSGWDNAAVASAAMKVVQGYSWSYAAGRTRAVFERIGREEGICI